MIVVWLLYVIGFFSFIAVFFGGNDPIQNKLNKELKMKLRLSIVFLLVFLSTGTDSSSYRELMWTLSLRIARDLFDGVDNDVALGNSL